MCVCVCVCVSCEWSGLWAIHAVAALRNVRTILLYVPSSHRPPTYQATRSNVAAFLLSSAALVTVVKLVLGWISVGYSVQLQPGLTEVRPALCRSTVSAPQSLQ